jgi:hypothetical protein
MEVEMAQIISNEQHEGLMGRTTNMIALPPFVVDDASGRKTPMPIARWKQELIWEKIEDVQEGVSN